MKLLPLYTDHIKMCLTASQIQTLKILVWLLTVQKTVKIERLSACFPVPIRYESRRKHLQRFLTLSALSLPLFWFPIIKLITVKRLLKFIAVEWELKQCLKTAKLEVTISKAVKLILNVLLT